MDNVKVLFQTHWSKYGQWRHPELWWKIQFEYWMSLKHPDKLKFNPKIIELNQDHLVFGMQKHMGRFLVSKRVILEDLNLNEQ